VDRRGSRCIAARKLDGERPGDNRDAAAADEAEDGDDGPDAGGRVRGRIRVRDGGLEEERAGGGERT
jgi:hypothetical protein